MRRDRLTGEAALRAVEGRVRDIARAGLDDRSLRQELLTAMRRAVHFEAHAWLLTDPETAVGSSPLADVPFLPELPRAIRLRYLTAINRWNLLRAPVALLSTATGGDLGRSPMWAELLSRHGITDACSCVHRDRFGCWGFLELWRTDGSFSAAEVAFLRRVADPITAALRSSQAATFGLRGGAAPTGPVVLILSAQLEVRTETQPSADYLRALVPPGPGQDRPVPASAYNVAAQLLAVEAGVDGSAALARVHLGGGSWLTVRAARLEAPGAMEGPDIAVSIAPASTGERAAVFALAAGLSVRERQLLGHLVTGADTREVAAGMHLSVNTVQDHLKSVFVKTGASSRRALLARVTGG